ncbi:MAG TPA: hypothetical protein VMH90_04355 [Thermoplasmata archaeon]|nr:hypothetical protein [Thermoplasmata archaeon]
MDTATLANIAFAGVTVFAAILTGIALAGVRRSRSPRMGLVACGFLLVTVQGVLVGVGLFDGGWDPTALLLLTALFEAALLLVLFLATLVR